MVAMAPQKKKPDTAWSKKLKAAQKRLTLDNDQMALRLGVSTRTYLSWKYNERTPPRFTQSLLTRQL